MMITDFNKREPFIRTERGAQAILSALETCFLINNHPLAEFWVPRHLLSGDNGHQAIMDYLTDCDWGSLLSHSPEFESLDHCLFALAFAATLAGVKTSDVIQ